MKNRKIIYGLVGNFPSASFIVYIILISTRQVCNLFQEPVEQPLLGFRKAEEKRKEQKDKPTERSGCAFGATLGKIEK